MEKQDAIKIFEDKKVRTIWDESQEKWYISIIDVIEVLTNNERPRKYWSDLKAKLKKEGSYLLMGNFIKQMSPIPNSFLDLFNPSPRQKQSLLNCGWRVSQRSESMRCKTLSSL